MMMLAAAGALQPFGDMIVVGLVLAMAAYGAHFGLFLAVLAGMHALVSLVVALAFAEPLAALLTWLEVPGAYAFPAAFGGLFVGAAAAIRLAVGGFVPAEAVRFTPGIDKGGGGLIGALAGLVLAGAVLIAFSIVPLPAALRIDGPLLRFDAGVRLLKTFARCVEPDEAKRDLLIKGEQPALSAPAESPSCSEVFADRNGNDEFDDGERYVDADGNGSFTIQLPYIDANGNGRRDVGIIDAYRLSAWRDAKVLNAPVIDSPATVDVTDEVSDGDVVYQIAAIDMDPSDKHTFGMKIEQQPIVGGQAKGDTSDGGNQAGYQDADLVSIDKATGAIKMADINAFLSRKGKPLKIVVIVTDKHGLKSEKLVTLKVKVAKPESGRPAGAGKP